MSLDITGVGTLASAAASIVDKFFPDKTQAQKDAAALEMQKLLGEQGLTTAQVEVNKIEAASTNWWVAGWRPYTGWVCGTGLAYQFLFAPICNGLASGLFTIAGITQTQPIFTAVDISTLLTCLGGMLGLGTLRTAEKHFGSEGNR